MHEVAGNVWYVARERDERLLATWSGALCSLASGSENRLAQARAELRQAEAICEKLSDEVLLEQIDVLGYLASNGAVRPTAPVRKGAPAPKPAAATTTATK